MLIHNNIEDLYANLLPRRGGMAATRLNDCNYIKYFHKCFTHKMYKIIDEFKKGLTDIIQDKEKFLIDSVEYAYENFLEERGIEEYLKLVLETMELTEYNIEKIKVTLMETKEAIKIVDIKYNIKEERAIVSFSNNSKIIFRNKSMENEAQINEIIYWFNLKSDRKNRLKIMKLVTLYKCGFTEYIEPKQNKNNKQECKYYLNLGKILLLVYILNYTNFKPSNLIRNGQYPVINNLEDLGVIKGENIQSSFLIKDVVQDILDKSVYNIDFVDNSHNLSKNLIDLIKQGFEYAYNLIVSNKMEFIEVIKGLENINSIYLSNIIPKIYGLNYNDLKRQLYFIDVRFKNFKYERLPINFSNDNELRQVNKENMLESAVEFGDHIIQKSIIVFNGYTTIRNWINTIKFKENIVLSSKCYNLNDGNGGIALFLLYLGVITKKDYFVKTAVEAMGDSIDKINNLEGLKGSNIKEITGEIYTLSKIYSITKDKNIGSTINRGITYLVNIVDEELDEIKSQNIVSIMEVLLSICENQDYEDIRGEVLNLVNLIYKNMIVKEGKLGLYYGDSKLIVVLAKILKLTDNRKIESVIKELLDMERNSKLKRNCEAHAEILLSRLSLKEIKYIDSKIDEEIRESLNYIIENGFNIMDNYYNEYIRNIQIVEYAAEILNNEDLKNRCVNTFYEVNEKIIEPAINEEINYGNKSLSLSNGLSGYGYGLLRIISRDTVPKMLWFQ